MTSVPVRLGLGTVPPPHRDPGPGRALTPPSCTRGAAATPTYLPLFIENYLAMVLLTLKPPALAAGISCDGGSMEAGGW